MAKFTPVIGEAQMDSYIQPTIGEAKMDPYVQPQIGEARIDPYVQSQIGEAQIEPYVEPKIGFAQLQSTDDEPIGMNADGTLVYKDYADPGAKYDPIAQPPAGEAYLGKPNASAVPPAAPQPRIIDEFQYNPNVSQETNEANYRIWLMDRGQGFGKMDPGQAYVPEGFANVSRQDVVPDVYAPDRDALQRRERGLVDDEQAILSHENIYRQEALRRDTLLAREQADRQAAKLAYIDKEVSKFGQAFDSATAEQRRLMKRGMNPYAGLSATGSNAGGQIVAALSMSAALSSGNPEIINQTSRMIDRSIDSEITRQRNEFEMAGERANNAYSRLMQSYDNVEQTEDQLRALMLGVADAEREEIAAQTAEPNTLLWAEKMKAEIDARYLEAKDSFMARAHGRVQEKYNQEQQFIPPHFVNDWKEWMTYRKMRGEESARTATTEGTYASTDLTRAKADKASAEVSGDSPDFKGLTTQRGKVANANGGLAMLNHLVKDAGSAGINYENLDWVGEMNDNAGRGLVDKLMLAIPGLNERGENYDRLMAQVFAAYRRSTTGASATEGELARIRADVDSTFESRHEAGLRAMITAFVEDKGAAYSVMPPEHRAFLDRQFDAVYGKGAVPVDSFGSRPIGGGASGGY